MNAVMPMTGLRLIAVNPRLLGDVLPLITDMLERMCKRSNGRYSMPGLLNIIATETWHLWVVYDGQDVQAVIGTELYKDVSGIKCCGIRFCTGRDASAWTHLLGQIEAWARAEGCAKIDMTARKGWAKHLPAFRLTHVMLEKDLT